MKILPLFLVCLGGCASPSPKTTNVPPSASEMDAIQKAYHTSPAEGLFARKAHKSDWIKVATLHVEPKELTNGEAIFYFETGFRAFVVFDDNGIPNRYENY